MPDLLPEFSEGDPYPGASYFNTLRKLIYRALRIQVDGVTMTAWQGSSGTMLAALGGSGDGIWIGKTSGAISARSGTTMGTGSVVRYKLVKVGSTVTLTTTSVTVSVWNYSGTSIADAKYCAVREVDGVPVVISAEC